MQLNLTSPWPVCLLVRGLLFMRSCCWCLKVHFNPPAVTLLRSLSCVWLAWAPPACLGLTVVSIPCLYSTVWKSALRLQASKTSPQPPRLNGKISCQHWSSLRTLGCFFPGFPRLSCFFPTKGISPEFSSQIQNLLLKVAEQKVPEGWHLPVLHSEFTEWLLAETQKFPFLLKLAHGSWFSAD